MRRHLSLRPHPLLTGTRLLTILVTAVLWISALGEPARVNAASAASALPACRYDDLLTRYRLYGDWHRSLLDTIYRLPSTYAPTDLASTSYAGLNGGYYVRRHVLYDLKAMASAARGAGAPIAVQSGYRSYTTQKRVFWYWVSVSGYQQALRTSARPGHSEHQLGTSLDFRSATSTRAPWDYYDWATTRAGSWMRWNAWRYGFVMSYPKGKSYVTCYDYEPWHYRYVGRARAKAIRDSGLTLRQWLWKTGGY